MPCLDSSLLHRVSLSRIRIRTWFRSSQKNPSSFCSSHTISSHLSSCESHPINREEISRFAEFGQRLVGWFYSYFSFCLAHSRLLSSHRVLSCLFFAQKTGHEERNRDSGQQQERKGPPDAIREIHVTVATHECW